MEKEKKATKREDNDLEYRPYQSKMGMIMAVGIVSLFLIIFGVSLGKIEIEIAADCVQADSIKMLLFSGVIAFYFSFSLVIGISSDQATIIFEENGLRLLNDNNRKYRYVQWKDFSYGYYYYNKWNKRSFLVLTHKSFDRKQIKKLIRQTNAEFCPFSKMYFNHAIVVSLDINRKKESDRMEEIVRRKIQYIEGSSGD